MNPLLRSLFRLVFLVWLLAVFACGAVVAQKTGAPLYGANLLTFLFTLKMPFVPDAPPQKEEEPVVEEKAPPQPAPPLPEAPPSRPVVPTGSRAGNGSLSRPVFEVLPDGAVEVRMAYQGTLGEKRSLQPANVASYSLDLLGSWSGLSGAFVVPGKGVIKKVQVGRHPDRVRFSALASEPVLPTLLRGEMYQAPGEIILLFRNESLEREPAAPAGTARP